MVFAKYRAVLFVHGCFWHRHEGCRYTTTPKSNTDFWQVKFDGNVSRDARSIALLREAGWRVGVVWECALRRSVHEAAEAVARWLQGDEIALTVE